MFPLHLPVYVRIRQCCPSHIPVRTRETREGHPSFYRMCVSTNKRWQDTASGCGHAAGARVIKDGWEGIRETMGPRGKMIIGVLLVFFGVGWYTTGIGAFLGYWTTLLNWQALLVLVQGGLGIFVLLIGAFVMWIEWDELRMRRELEEAGLGSVERSVEAATEEPEEETAEVETEGDHVCDECGKTFDSERGLHIHEGMQH